MATHSSRTAPTVPSPTGPTHEAPVTAARGLRLRPGLLAMAAALLCVLVSRWAPLPGPLLLSLALGAVVTNTRLASTRHLEGHAGATRGLLRVGIVLLGLQLPLTDLAAIGTRGVVVVVTTVVATYTLTRTVGAQLPLASGFVTLLAAGFSICGAAAVAAVNDTVRARERDVAHAVALVTVFGTALVVLVPWGSRALDLSLDQGAVWAGASIHEVAQVLAAASLVGPGAVALAATVKLGRVALLAPTYVVAARATTRLAGAGARGARRAPVLPWFLVGFVLTACLRSTGTIPAALLDVTGATTTVLLGAGMVGLGLGLRLRDLWPLPLPALLLATWATLVAAGTSLALVLSLY